MVYESKNFDHLLGTPGFSDNLLKNHFTLYQGYVKNTNLLIETLSKMLSEGKAGIPEFTELKRRFGWEFNGMRLHEFYFGNMKKTLTKINKNSNFSKQLTKEFSSYENWEKDFKAVGAMRGIGWVILCYDPIGKRMFNIWINEHDTGHLADSVPLLVMDVFEHAFMLDYSLKRADYINAFFNAVDWETVVNRFDKCAI